MARAGARRLGKVVVAAWFAAMVAVGAGALAKHVVAFRVPAADAHLAASIGALRRPGDEGRFTAVHVLYAECRCSQRIVDHLAATTRPADYVEIVLWVGDPAPPASLAERGFDVRRVSTEDLERLGIEAAPMLVALHPKGGVRYAGGYSRIKQGPVIEDLAILEAAKGSPLLASLPLFGCAVSERLRSQLASLPNL